MKKDEIYSIILAYAGPMKDTHGYVKDVILADMETMEEIAEEIYNYCEKTKK
jgi:hypothetical protein